MLARYKNERFSKVNIKILTKSVLMMNILIQLSFEAD